MRGSDEKIISNPNLGPAYFYNRPLSEQEKQDQKEALDYVASLYYERDSHKWEP